jgi:hypothetical protein
VPEIILTIIITIHETLVKKGMVVNMSSEFKTSLGDALKERF